MRLNSTELATVEQGQVEHALAWLTRLPKLPLDEFPQVDHIEATVAALSQPVDPVWCMARVAALLNPYYDKDTPQAVRVMEAEDWMEELAPFPQWAIERSVRWWKSAENERRWRRPLEGDISSRCKVEMRGIGAVPDLVRRRLATKDNPSPRPTPYEPPPRVTPEAAAAILTRAGYRVKPMGGE